MRCLSEEYEQCARLLLLKATMDHRAFTSSITSCHEIDERLLSTHVVICQRDTISQCRSHYDRRDDSAQWRNIAQAPNLRKVINQQNTSKGGTAKRKKNKVAESNAKYKTIHTHVPCAVGWAVPRCSLCKFSTCTYHLTIY